MMKNEVAVAFLEAFPDVDACWELSLKSLDVQKGFVPTLLPVPLEVFF